MSLQISPHVFIDQRELAFTFSASPGPGGQNVNKLATKATLTFDVANSPSLTPDQRATLLHRLANRINAEGVLRVVAHTHRTQSANRAAAVARFVELLADALRPRKTRRPTRPTRASAQRRLEHKSRRGQVKRQRRYRAGD